MVGLIFADAFLAGGLYSAKKDSRLYTTVIGTNKDQFGLLHPLLIDWDALEDFRDALSPTAGRSQRRVPRLPADVLQPSQQSSQSSKSWHSRGTPLISSRSA
jgi:hypothetical protein